MRSSFVILFLLLSATAFGQSENIDQIKKLLRDVLQDSALSADLAKINGLPSRLHFTFQKEEKQEITLNAQLLQKEYLGEKELRPASISHYKHRLKKYQEVASFTILLPDGTKASIRAVLFSPKQAWHPTFYHLRGRNIETGGKMRMIRFET